MDAAFEYLALGSPLHDQRALDRVLAPLVSTLHRLGGVAASGPPTDPLRPSILVALTGGTEQRMLDAWAARRALVPWEPFVVVAHGGHNSLPAALEAAARVQQDGGRSRIVYVGADGGGQELARVVDDLRVRAALGALRIGQVGAPSDWLVASAPPAAVVARRWGPTLVPLGIEAVVAAALAGGPAHDPLAAAVLAGAQGAQGPGADDVDLAARVVPALDRVVDDERLDAVTVRCFDLVTEGRTSGCLALADLNDRGVTAGCEGDVVSTITMAWLRLLLGTVPWMANPVRLDVARNTVLLAHCTIARTLVRGYRLRTHFESGLGVAIDGDVDADDVTLVRVGGADLERLWVGEGAVVAAPHEEDLCRTQLHVALDRGHVAELLRAPLGNHLVVVPGRHAERVEGWWELLVAGPAAVAATGVGGSLTQPSRAAATMGP